MPCAQIKQHLLQEQQLHFTDNPANRLHIKATPPLLPETACCCTQMRQALNVRAMPPVLYSFQRQLRLNAQCIWKCKTYHFFPSSPSTACAALRLPLDMAAGGMHDRTAACSWQDGSTQHSKKLSGGAEQPIGCNAATAQALPSCRSRCAAHIVHTNQLFAVCYPWLIWCCGQLLTPAAAPAELLRMPRPAGCTECSSNAVTY